MQRLLRMLGILIGLAIAVLTGGATKVHAADSTPARHALVADSSGCGNGTSLSPVQPTVDTNAGATLDGSTEAKLNLDRPLSRGGYNRDCGAANTAPPPIDDGTTEGQAPVVSGNAARVARVRRATVQLGFDQALPATGGPSGPQGKSGLLALGLASLLAGAIITRRSQPTRDLHPILAAGLPGQTDAGGSQPLVLAVPPAPIMARATDEQQPNRGYQAPTASGSRIRVAYVHRAYEPAGFRHVLLRISGPAGPHYGAYQFTRRLFRLLAGVINTRPRLSQSTGPPHMACRGSKVFFPMRGA